MELRQIRYFLAVADTRSFVSAAQTLFISRQAISKSIAMLEEELNVELFMRDSNGAFLSPAGMLFYDRARAVVMELDNLRSQMQNYGTRYHQRIRIAFSIGTLPLLEDTLQDYRENQNNADISFEEYPEDACQKLLLEHKADVLISTREFQDPLYDTRLLLCSPFGVLIRQQENLHEVTIQDLTWIPLGGQTDSQTQLFCQRHGLSLRYQGYDLHRLFSLTQQGKCALLLPQCLVPKQLDQLIWFPIQKGGDWNLYMTYARSAQKNLLYSAALDDLQHRIFSVITPEAEDRP